MEDFHFANPAYLLLLLALPALYFAISRLGKNAHARLLAFVSAANLKHLLQNHGGTSSKVKPWLFWLGLCCFALALARPQANPIVEEMEGASLDIYVLLDVSRSMDAEDMPPSRLKKAKREIQSLMSLLSGDRVGLIAFAGSAVIISPLTSDYEVMKTFLQNVDTSLIQNQTTDINAALTLAEQAMKRGAERTGKEGPRSNVFIVMSDGEDQEEAGNYAAADRIKSEGGTVFTIAFGTEAGSKIPARNERGELMGYKRDRSGTEVVTKVSPKSMQDIAARGGGQFYFSTLDEGEITDIINRTKNMQRDGATMMKARIYQEYFVPVLALGALLVALSFFTRKVSVKGLNLKRGTLGLLLIWALPAQASPLSFLYDKERRASEEAKTLAQEGKVDEAVGVLNRLMAENPDSAALNYNVGTYLLQGNKGEEGRQQLQRLQNAPGIFHYSGKFNVAGSLASEGKKEEARAAYADLISELTAKPSLSKEEQQILELAKKNVSRLADPQQQPPKNQPQEQQKQDQKNEQDKKDQGQKGQQGENKDQKDSKDQKPEDKKDEQKKEDQKDNKGEGKDSDKKDQSQDGKNGEQKKEDKPGEENKKEDQKDGEQGKDQEKKQQPQKLPPKGRQPFKERDNLSEDSAKRLLQELKLNETSLQKRFLQRKDRGNEKRNGSDKDW